MTQNYFKARPLLSIYVRVLLSSLRVDVRKISFERDLILNKGVYTQSLDTRTRLV